MTQLRQVQKLDSGLWTLDWTYGLDCGLIFGLEYGQTPSSVATISHHVLVQ